MTPAPLTSVSQVSAAEVPRRELSRGALRLTRRLLGVEVAAWVPLDPPANPVVEGEGPWPLLRALAGRADAAGAALVVEDVAAVASLTAWAERYRFFAAVPVADPSSGALVVLGAAPRPTPPGDYAALADLAALVARSASGAPDVGRDDTTEALQAAVLSAEQARERAEAGARAQNAFLAAMSHEIRTPLTGIIGFADILGETAEGEAREFAELIRKSARRLVGTLNSVLDLARVEAGQANVRSDRLDLGAEVAEAAELLRPLAEEKGLRLEVETPAVHALGDAAVLHRIVNNLVGNAIKFTEAGRVRVRVRRDGTTAALRVEDTGRGMEAAFLERLFEPYRRELEGPGRPNGSGLGLAITKRLVELLGGTIEVSSHPGVGTAVTVRLPAA